MLDYYCRYWFLLQMFDIKELSSSADLMPGEGRVRGHSFHFTRPPSMFNSPYFEPYFPNLALLLVSMTSYDLKSYVKDFDLH